MECDYGTVNVIIGSRNVIMRLWNVNTGPCNMIMGPRNVNWVPWNVIRGPWNMTMERGM